VCTVALPVSLIPEVFPIRGEGTRNFFPKRGGDKIFKNFKGDDPPIRTLCGDPYGFSITLLSESVGQ